MKIYVVFGVTGEYSDRKEWPVVSYRDEQLAQDHVVRATERAKEWEAIRKENYDSPPTGWNQYDESMVCDYTGTSYFYHTIELLDYGVK